MIRIVIIEDEPPAVRRLTSMLANSGFDCRVIASLDSVSNAITFFLDNPGVDLIISDIQLADGNSFEIFHRVEVGVPIIFATAYDEFLLKAFQVNSIDYLLKPYEDIDLRNALKKYEGIYEKRSVYTSSIDQLLQWVKPSKYKERFLVKRGKELVIVPVDHVAYFFSEEGYVHLVDINRNKFIIEPTLDKLLPELNPNNFFRISRKYLIHSQAIQKIHPYFNSRLKLSILPQSTHEVIVSRERVNDFKNWLDR